MIVLLVVVHHSLLINHQVQANDLGEVNVEVAVLKGGLLDILVEVSDPDGQKVLSRMYFEGKGPNHIPFVADKAGDYEICFNNEMARWTSKMVSFKAVIKAKASNTDAVKPEDVSVLEQKLGELQETLVQIMEQQQHFKDRESSHSSTLQSTQNRITYYSLFESAILVALSAVQIYFVKKWFDSPSSATSRSFV